MCIIFKVGAYCQGTKNHYTFVREYEHDARITNLHLEYPAVYVAQLLSPKSATGIFAVELEVVSRNCTGAYFWKRCVIRAIG